MVSVPGELADLVRAQAARWRVPGCAVGVTGPDADPLIVTVGVADVRSPEPVSERTLFRIGSVTKVLTSTLVMLGVEEGRLGLDDLVMTHLPDLRLGDPDAADTLTIRHLLIKADGIYDHVEGFGADDGCLARYVDSLDDVGQVARPGALYSYSNTGPVVAARVLEAVHGIPFDRIVEERLLQPLHLADTVHVVDNADINPPGPVSVDGRPLATRHTHDARFEPVAGGPGSPPALDEPRAMAACGTTLAATIGDAITFASSQLPGRRNLLATPTLAQMHHPQIVLPPLNFGSAIGWFSAPNRPWVLRHNGGSRPPGTFAQLTIAPEHGIAIAVLANAVTGAMLADAVVSYVLSSHQVAPAAATAPVEPPRPEDCAGTYERGHARFTVTAAADGNLSVTVDPGPLGDQDPKFGASGTYTPGVAPWFTGPGGQIGFVHPDEEGRFTYLHDARAARRMDDAHRL